MWEIVKKNNNQLYSPSGSKIGKQNIIQQCSWKYGVVIISDRQDQQYQLTQTQVLITTQPFDKQYKDKQKNQRVIIVESGEQNKIMETVDEICRKFQQKNVNKQSTVYIKGGGMLLDICGFACAIYMRGVNKVVYIPTTLLAIVDATVGGKTGVNWGGAKNTLGVISHPTEIRISLHYLETLTDRDFSNGLAEVIKMSLTHDSQLFSILQNKQLTTQKLRTNPILLRQIIKRSLQIKIRVVQNDERDKNERKFLNFGHTIGHAIQLSKSGKKYMHGQCVSIGILQIIKLSQMLGLMDNKNIYQRIFQVFKKFNLPTKLPQNIDTVQIIQLMSKDKKNIKSQHVEVVLINDIGIRQKTPTSISITNLYKYFSQNIRITTTNINSLPQKISQINSKWLQQNIFPSSKSLSIRYLFLSSLHYLKYNQSIKVTNFLQSDDTQYLKQSLKTIGFLFQQNLSQKYIVVKDFLSKNYGVCNVGNSGLTARFILPLCAYLKGQWTIQCHKRMSQRPNKEIFQFCQQHYDCNFEWLNNIQYTFPVKIRTKGQKKESLQKPIINLKSQQSSQFISSALLNSYLWCSNQQILIKIPAGKLVSQSYISMTIKCLEEFGIHVNSDNTNNNYSTIKMKNIKQYNRIKQVTVQQDLSSFSYPYALSLIHKANLPKIPEKSSQGDLQFYQYCQQIINGTLPEHLQFSQCTDTFMTMSAILATNQFNHFKLSNNIQIHGIANQRVKQSNRIQQIKANLQKIGYIIKQTQDGLIFPSNLTYKQFKNGQIVVFQTAGDHRLAMSMAILASNLNHKFNKVYFVIDNKNVVKKTFPKFWEYLKEVGIQACSEFNDREINAVKQKYKAQLRTKQNKTPKLKQSSKKIRKILIVGNRGSGKSSIAEALCRSSNSLLIDIDKQITNTITNQYSSTLSPVTSISQYVEQFGWEQFRKLQNNQLTKFMNSSSGQPTNRQQYQNVIISVGGGVVDWQQSVNNLKNSKNIPKIYIQKQYKNLKIEINNNRPHIPNFEEVIKIRSKKYQQIADYIITLPQSMHLKLDNIHKSNNPYKQINQYIINEYNLLLTNIQNTSKTTNNNTLKQGYIYCIPQLYDEENKIISLCQQQQFMAIKKNLQLKQNQNINHVTSNQLSGFELRVDLIAQQQLKMNKNIGEIGEQELMKQCRYAISQFKIQNQHLLKNVPIILTLRTKSEFGVYPFVNYKNSTIEKYTEQQGYFKWIASLQKIISSYIDYQFNYIQHPPKSSKIFPNFSDKKPIYSYHGSSLKTINQILQFYNKFHLQSHQPKHLTKLCYNGSNQIWFKNQSIWKQSSDICVYLKYPLSRLENKYKMVIRQNDTKKLIDIPTRIQLEMLKGLKRFFK